MRTGADEARSPKYSHVERERRFLVDPALLPPLSDRHVFIEDRYIVGTRCRLRRMTDSVSGEVALKLAKKYETDDPTARPTVSAYLDENEYAAFAALEAHVVVKRRHDLPDGEAVFSIDVFAGSLTGLTLAEIECDDAMALAGVPMPRWAIREVSLDPRYQGGALAASQMDGGVTLFA